MCKVQTLKQNKPLGSETAFYKHFKFKHLESESGLCSNVISFKPSF